MMRMTRRAVTRRNRLGALQSRGGCICVAFNVTLSYSRLTRAPVEEGQQSIGEFVFAAALWSDWCEYISRVLSLLRVNSILLSFE